VGTIAQVAEPMSTSVRARFIATIFTGSFLLFLVQPMVAKMALPRLGGAPSVWNSAMLVYQALLLAGYAYAHWLGRFQARRQAEIHVALLVLAGLTLPIGLLPFFPPAASNPFLWVPWLLILSIGPLFFVVSAQAPLLQRWFAFSDSGDPYPLYAASNLGSFGGLIAYPLFVEPWLGLNQQRWLWSIGYGLLVMLVAWCGVRLPRSTPQQNPVVDTIDAPRPKTVGQWIALAMVPSGLILSTTLHITTDVVAMPLLWVLPLAAYLLSFTIAFAANRRLAGAILRIAPFILLLACFGVFMDRGRLLLLFGPLAIVNLFTLSVALHSRLYELRPPKQQLTLFYLAMSVGGALGGLFCALIAPLIFNWTYEHLLLLIAAGYLMLCRSPFDRFVNLWDGGKAARVATIAGIVTVALLAVVGKQVFGLPGSEKLSLIAALGILAVGIFAIGSRPLFAASVAALLFAAGGWQKLELSASPGKMTRSFFGIYAIQPGEYNSRVLVHGTTLHGIQNLGSPERSRTETSYYAHRSGVGLAMDRATELFGPNTRVAIVGLGAGTLACYARPGQSWTFYEIDPAVVSIARDPSRFTFLSQCTPDAPIKLGDARLVIEREPAGAADLLVLDAFSSDSIPTHLLTREAFQDYRRLLSGRGLLLVHISNRFLDLKPVIAAAAADGGWTARLRIYRPDATAEAQNETESDWIAMSPSSQTMERLVRGSGQTWTPVPQRAGFAPWTDDHASVLPLISLARRN
jgi:hypothetical protein